MNEQQVLGREQKVEYRDQDGNMLDEEQVKSLEGKVEFHTRYETRTRTLDIDGNPIPEAGGSPEGVAPPHPDVEGNNPETVGVKEDDSAARKEKPATQSEIKGDVGKEKAIDGAQGGEARPASEGNEATKKS